MEKNFSSLCMPATENEVMSDIAVRISTVPGHVVSELSSKMIR